MKIKKKLLLLGILCLPTIGLAIYDEPATSDIASLFPIAAQSHSSEGMFHIKNDAKIIGVKNNEVDFKHHDKLDGKCDGKNCEISEKLAPSYNLKWGNNYITLPAFNGYVSGGYEPACKNNNVITDNVFTDIFLTGGSGCTLKPKVKDVYVKGKVDVTSNLTLKLAPGDYWMNSLILNYGNIEVVGSGDVNLYVKEKVVLKGAIIGSKQNPVNIYHYEDEDADFGESLTWYGDFFTKGKVKYQGSTKLYGAVRAKAIDIQGSGELHLAAGEYWYDNVIVKGGAHLILADAALTTLHIKVQLESEGGSTINKNAKPLFLIFYDDNDASLHLKASANLYGHVYTKGGVELNGGHIYGAVNVHSLFIKGGGITYSPLSGIPGAKLDHYRLHYDSAVKKITAEACADNGCNFYYQDVVKKLHIKDGVNNNNIANFGSFSKISAAESYMPKYKKDQCVQFAIHNPSTDPLPNATLGLRCLKDGVPLAECKLCPQEELPAVELAGFIFGDIVITEQHLTGISQGATLTLDSISGNGSLTRNQQVLTSSSPVSLPLVVSYNKAENVELNIKAKKGNVEQLFKLNLMFVPKFLTWMNTSTECVNKDEQFIYTEHKAKCHVLGKAGDTARLTLQALGENDRVIANYSAQQTNLITVSELNDKALLADATTAIVSSLDFTNEQKIAHTVKTVGLIQASVEAHCAAYARNNENGDCALMTQGDTALLGRTVPAFLSVKPIAGDIKDNVVYAAQPQPIKFMTTPVFILKGLDINGNELRSYTGEFAGGLLGSSKIKLDSKLSDSALTLRHSEPNPNKDGSHKLELVSTSLKFLKDKPFSETSLALPLVLTINDHDQTKGLTDKANLGDEDDQLRYGFLSIDKLDLPVNTAGDMPVHLNYYGSNTDTIDQDKKTSTGIETSHSIFSLTSDSGVATVKPTGLEFNEQTIEDKLVKVIKVPTHSSEWRGKVEMEVDKWLKPYENGLVNPIAELVIKNTARGNDRIFNRREVVR